MTSTRDIYNDYDDYDEITDGEPISQSTSTRRYQPTNTAMILGEPPRRQRSSLTVDVADPQDRQYRPVRRRTSDEIVDTSNYTTFIPADQRYPGDIEDRQRARRMRRPEPGPKFVRHDPEGNVLDEYGNVVRSRRPQLQQRQVQTTQPRAQRQPVTTGPVVSRRGAMKFLGWSAVGAVAILATNIPHWMEEQAINENHFHQGDTPEQTISRVVGHNGDSKANPTILTFKLVGKQFVFEEVPAGDNSKTRVTPLFTLDTLRYTGPHADLFLSISLTQVGTRYSVELTTQWYESTLLLLYKMSDPISTILVDLGHGYFESPSSK